MVLSYALVAVLFFLCIFLFLKYRQEHQQNRQKEKINLQEIEKNNVILHNLNVCFLLIDKDFIVRKTNYYRLNHLSPDGTLKRVGDLLKCRNAVISGECGTHECCKICGIRATIGQAFYRKSDFKKMEASMKIFDRENKQITPCDVSVSGTYLNMDGEEKMLLTVYDISELKNVQRLLNIERENAISVDKLKSAFIANMSHEIRTPLNAIVGFSSLLATTADEEEKNMYLDIINKNNSRLLQLINDILDLSQIESGTLNFDYSEFDVNDLLKELNELFKIRLQEKPGVNLVCESGLDPIMISSEKERVVQVLVGLMDNAIKFTKSGEIRFGCRITDEKEICFYVKDTGIGIPSEIQDKIFSRFTKLNREMPGTGLGLALSQSIVEKLGGKISMESQAEKGSTFWFTLPLQK